MLRYTPVRLLKTTHNANRDPILSQLYPPSHSVLKLDKRLKLPIVRLSHGLGSLAKPSANVAAEHSLSGDDDVETALPLSDRRSYILPLQTEDV
jgi:hypothetical protein